MDEQQMKDLWLIRPCEIYKEEYKDCKSLLSSLYQHYIDGIKSDCIPWWTDYTNCMKFRQTKDPKAAEALITSERQRRRLRIMNAKTNDVWEYRTSPPPEWSAPLQRNEQQCKK